MFDEILAETEKIKGPVTVAELSRRLGIERSALEGMLEFLHDKGRLEFARAGEWDACVAMPRNDCALGKFCCEIDRGDET